MSVRDRLIQLTLRARNFLSDDVAPATESMRELTEEGRRLKASMDEVGRARGLARTLRDNQQATEGLERAQRDARATLDDLTREIGDNATATAGQRIAMREARRTLEEAALAYKRNQQAIKNTTSELKKLGVDTDNVVAEEKRLTNELEDGKRALATNRDAIREKRAEEKKAADTTKEHAERVDAAKGAMADAGRKVLAFAAAYISLNAAMGLVQRGLSLVSQGIRAVAMDGSDKQQALAQLEATLASTGRQAEFTTKQLLDMADAMESSSMLTAEQVQSAQARLLSYTDVAANEFPRALQIVIDQQQRLGISAEQSAEIVGRALQSPSKAMAALGRQGFTLEAGQQQLLKQLEATGRMAEAQSIIMDMLTEAYGGAAAAARMNTFQGLLKDITDRFGDFASRVANSGAFEYMQRKLVDLSDYLDEMANDGRLDDIAQSLSDAFVNGAEAVSEYVKKLAEVDFEGLANRASAMARQIGPAIETTVSAGRAVVATLSTVWNAFSIAVTSTAAVLVKAVQLTVGSVGLAVGQIAGFFGGDEIRQKAEGLYTFLGELSDAYVAQAKTDLGQIADAWNSTSGIAEAGAERQSRAAKRAAEETRKSMQKAGEDIASFFRTNITGIEQALAAISFAATTAELEQVSLGLKASKLNADDMARALAALEERRGIVSLGDDAKRAGFEIEQLRKKQEALREEYFASKITLEQWQQGHNDAAEAIRNLESQSASASGALTDQGKAIARLRGEQAALRDEYNTGKISLEQWQEGHNAAAEALRRLGANTVEATNTVHGLDDALTRAGKATSALELANLGVAITRAFHEGRLSAEEYAKAQEAIKDKTRELKGEIEKTGDAGEDAGKKLLRSQEMYNEALEDGIVTNEELRRISGQRMEEERKGLTDLKDSSERDMSAMEDFFGGVMSRAREPVAALSRAALEAFDRLRGISSAAPSIDTSSLDATRTSLESVSKALGDVRAALAMPMQSSLARWMAETQQASLQTQQAFLSQKASLQSLMQSYERGSITAQQFVRQANSMKHALSLLDESDLSGLESAIEAANQRMKQMGDSTRSTLESLQDELDGLQGRQDDIERRRFAARQRELQAQLAEAQAGGDAQAVANASRALGLLRQIEAESAQARQAEEQKKRMEAEQATQPAAQQPEQTPSKVIRLEIPGSPAVDVSVSGDAAEADLLSILEQAGLRSL